MSREGKSCGKQLDAEGFHSTICHKGLAQYRPHKALVNVLELAAKEGGWETATETIIPDLLQEDTGGLEDET